MVMRQLKETVVHTASVVEQKIYLRGGQRRRVKSSKGKLGSSHVGQLQVTTTDPGNQLCIAVKPMCCQF